ncbi:hypothetical protein [Chitinimonas lacunae]|uniref:DUF945 domain-containing protein n=1 Tax=Chitinimonas lacunae TaxID=1963018 RepID=A0ABV8MPJ5_9NEIS
MAINSLSSALNNLTLPRFDMERSSTQQRDTPRQTTSGDQASRVDLSTPTQALAALDDLSAAVGELPWRDLLGQALGATLSGFGVKAADQGSDGGLAIDNFKADLNYQRDRVQLSSDSLSSQGGLARFEHRAIDFEQEALHFSASGTIKLEDGRQLEFKAEISIARLSLKSEQTRIETDQPLELNFDRQGMQGAGEGGNLRQLLAKLQENAAEMVEAGKDKDADKPDWLKSMDEMMGQLRIWARDVAGIEGLADLGAFDLNGQGVAAGRDSQGGSRGAASLLNLQA